MRFLCWERFGAKAIGMYWTKTFQICFKRSQGMVFPSCFPHVVIAVVILYWIILFIYLLIFFNDDDDYYYYLFSFNTLVFFLGYGSEWVGANWYRCKCKCFHEHFVPLRESHFFYREVTGKVGFIIALSTRKGLDLQFLTKLISRYLKTSTCKPKKNLSRFWFLGFQQHLDYFVIIFFLPWFTVFATVFSLDLNLSVSCVYSSGIEYGMQASL